MTVDLDFRATSKSGLNIYAGFLNNATRVYEFSEAKKELKL